MRPVSMITVPRLRKLRLRTTEKGFTSVEFMVAVALSFLLLVMLSNLILIQYGRGIVRAAADEGVRAGARFDASPVSACEQRAHSVLDGVGRLGSDVQLNCAVVNGQVQATATAKFHGWLPTVPTFTEKATAVSNKEVAPQ